MAGSVVRRHFRLPSAFASQTSQLSPVIALYAMYGRPASTSDCRDTRARDHGGFAGAVGGEVFTECVPLQYSQKRSR